MDKEAFARPTVRLPNGDLEWGAPGMTLREHYAGLAMQAILTRGLSDDFVTQMKIETLEQAAKAIATSALLQADAMIEAREKKP